MHVLYRVYFKIQSECIPHALRSAHGISKIRLRLVGTPECTGFRIDEMQYKRGMEMQVSRQTISKWEAGQSYPDFTRLVMLSD